MRILFASHHASARLPLDLGALGHQLKTVSTAGELARALFGRRPDAAWIEASALAPKAAALLAARRVPFVLELADDPVARPEGALPISTELARQSWRLAATSACHVVAPSVAAAERIANSLELPAVSVVPRAFDLALLPLGERSEARSALGLDPSARFIGLVATDALVSRLDLVGFAQRHLPGVGLLITASGPAENAVTALALSARPSTPVIHVGPHRPSTLVATVCAADICLGLDDDLEIALAYAALGRRQVSLSDRTISEVAALYPQLGGIAHAAPEPDALREALKVQLERESLAPISAYHVRSARASMSFEGRAQRAAEILSSCA